MAETMSNAKTHYQTLGVQPDAEDVVIKAAYRALAQRYHPDKWQGDPAIATARMAEINGAYEVLSDPLKRAKYDEQIKASGEDSQFSDAQMDEDVLREFIPEYEEEWSYASEYYPELKPLFESLKKVSKNLAFEFKITLLVLKKFNRANQIYEKMRSEFLSRYFGRDSSVLSAVEGYLSDGNEPALIEINKAIRILGSSFDATTVLARVAIKHGNSMSISSKIKRANNIFDAEIILKSCGYEVVRAYKSLNTYYVIKRDGKTVVESLPERQLVHWLKHDFLRHYRLSS
jgi:curved DNA-binding protein CbpA